MPGSTCPSVSEGDTHQKEEHCFLPAAWLTGKEELVEKPYLTISPLSGEPPQHRSPASGPAHIQAWMGKEGSNRPLCPLANSDSQKRTSEEVWNQIACRVDLPPPTACEAKVEQERRWFWLLLVFVIAFRNTANGCEATARISSLRGTCDLRLSVYSPLCQPASSAKSSQHSGPWVDPAFNEFFFVLNIHTLLPSLNQSWKAKILPLALLCLPWNSKKKVLYKVQHYPREISCLQESKREKL